MSSRRICFVSFEIAPFTGGGIGTWLKNTLNAYSSRNVQLEVLIFGQPWIDPAVFAMVFPKVTINQIDVDNPPEGIVQPWQPQRANGFDSFAAWRSYILMRALQDLERRTGAYDVIEFVDWHGIGFYTLQEKRLGHAFQSTWLSVRLHATDSVIRDYETRWWSDENLVVADLERQAIQNADIVVAHLWSTVDVVQQHYGFDATWRQKVIVNVPPVHVGLEARSTTAIDPDRTPIVFTSRLQSIKRPDVFIKGACAFLAATPEYKGQIFFAADDADSELRQRVENAIPNDLRHRVSFLPTQSQEVREKLIAQSIAVFPNAFEAFCFAAYEASLLGAVVVLNGSNPGFGDGTPWTDGLNCKKFKETSRELDKALRDVFLTQCRSALDSGGAGFQPVSAIPEETPYWENIPRPSQGHDLKADLEENIQVAVLIPCLGNASELPSVVSSILMEQALPLEIIVLDGRAEESNPFVFDALERLSNNHPGIVRILRQQVPADYPMLVNIGVELARAPYVAVFPADMLPTPGFLSLAVRALSRSPDYAVVVPAMRVIDPDNRSKSDGYWMPLGEAVHSGLFVNRLGWGSFLARKDIVRSYRMDEVLTSDWCWDFLMRLSFAGQRLLVTSEAGVEATMSAIEEQTSRSELQRRSTIETIRRRYAITTGSARVPLSVLGDGELVTAGLYMPSKMEVIRHEAEANRLRAELEALQEASAVRIARALSKRFASVPVWLRKPILRTVRALMR